MRIFAALAGAPIAAPFVLRAVAAGSSGAGSGPLVIAKSFPLQQIRSGENIAISALCVLANIAAAVNASFTLFDSGTAVAGFSGLAATATPEPAGSNRLRLSVGLDLASSPGSDLPAGLYDAQFVLLPEGGGTVLIEGALRILPGEASGLPGEAEDPQ
jgi:hypothetical protein